MEKWIRLEMEMAVSWVGQMAGWTADWWAETTDVRKVGLMAE